MTSWTEPTSPVAERRRQGRARSGEAAKKGQPVAPWSSRAARSRTTFWGKAWCDNLETLPAIIANRLPRGRTYVRNGSVVDLQIAPGEVTAMVSGSELYKVKVTSPRCQEAQWRRSARTAPARIDSLVELLQGRMSKGVMERICRQGRTVSRRPRRSGSRAAVPTYAFDVQARGGGAVRRRRPAG